MLDEMCNYRQSSLVTVPISEESETLRIKFEETQTDKQLVMLHKPCDLKSASTADDTMVAYKAGFKDGATAMIEIMT